MQFQVPQFIEVEDKIFGPLTFRQFVYIAGGLGSAYLLWRLLPLFIAGPLGLAIVAFAVALAFFQYNSRPFILTLESAFYFLLRPRLYLWNNERKTQKKAPVQTAASAGNSNHSDLYVPKLSDSKLHELAWSLDIKERIASGTQTDDESPLGRPNSERRDVLSMMHTAHEARIEEAGASTPAHTIAQ